MFYNFSNYASSSSKITLKFIKVTQHLIFADKQHVTPLTNNNPSPSKNNTPCLPTNNTSSPLMLSPPSLHHLRLQSHRGSNPIEVTLSLAISNRALLVFGSYTISIKSSYLLILISIELIFDSL